MIECKFWIGELYMWSMSWNNIIKPIVNTTCSWASSMICNNEMWNKRIRSKKFIFKFSPKEIFDVDATLSQLLLIITLAIPKKQSWWKISDQERKEDELDKGIDEGVEFCARNSSVTKKHQRYRRCQHTLKN
jgi:hypothetical protein